MSDLSLPRDKGAIYRRVSLDKQDGERQKNAISRWLERHGLTVDDDLEFEDVGWVRRKAQWRPEFQRLLREVEAGRVKWIIVDRQDRFEAADKFEFFHYLHVLRRHGCRLFTADDKELTSNETVSALTTHLNSDVSEKELREKSVRVLEKMVDMAEDGIWLGGRVQFGMDVVAFRREGGKLVEQWRVEIVHDELRVKIDREGQRREYAGKNNFPATEADEILQLRPSKDLRKIEVVLSIFSRFASESTNFNAIARQLNEENAVKPAYADRWRFHHVREILRNPCYIGKPPWNRHTSGGYNMWKGGNRQEKVPNTVPQDHDRADWVLPTEPIFEPVVPVDLWNAVQEKLAAVPAKRRGPKSARLWLSGLLVCAKCKMSMCGKIVPKSNRPVYICSSYVKFDGKRKDSPCQINTISHEKVEAKIKEFLADTGRQLDEFVEGVRKVGTPKTLIGAVKTAMVAWAGVHTRVRAEYTQRELQAVDPQHYDDHVLAVYEGIFDLEQNRHRARLDQLETEHSRLVEHWNDLPTERAKAKAKARMVEVETEIERLEQLLINQAEQYRRAAVEADELKRDWDAAKAALSSEKMTRQKAEAVRRVIDRIVLTFEHTGRRRPASVLTQWEFFAFSPQSQLGSKSASEQMSRVYEEGSGYRCP